MTKTETECHCLVACATTHDQRLRAHEAIAEWRRGETYAYGVRQGAIIGIMALTGRCCSTEQRQEALAAHPEVAAAAVNGGDQ